MKKKIDAMEFEEAVDELEKIVQRLGEGDVSLKEASELYERGVALKNHCTKILETTELKLNQISKNLDGTVNIEKMGDIEL